MCIPLWTMFLVILVVALQSVYWISPGIKNRALCNLILFGIFSNFSCVVFSAYLLRSFSACNSWAFQSMNFNSDFFLINRSLFSLSNPTSVWKFSRMIIFSSSVLYCVAMKFLSKWWWDSWLLWTPEKYPNSVLDLLMAWGAPPTSVFVLLLSCHLILLVLMHVCRPHGDREGIRFGNFKVLFQCVSFPCAPWFCAILVLALAL